MSSEIKGAVIKLVCAQESFDFPVLIFSFFFLFLYKCIKINKLLFIWHLIIQGAELIITLLWMIWCNDTCFVLEAPRVDPCVTLWNCLFVVCYLLFLRNGDLALWGQCVCVCVCVWLCLKWVHQCVAHPFVDFLPASPVSAESRIHRLL